ncbi:hypothetical protein D3C73_890900 [compost metagenome]
MQTGRHQDPLHEGEQPHAEGIGFHIEALHGVDPHLDLGPELAGQPGHGQHDEEGDDEDQAHALEDGEVIRQLLLEETVVDPGHHAADDEGEDDAGIQRLDAPHQRQAAGAAHFLIEVDPKLRPPEGEHAVGEVVVGHVGKEGDQRRPGLTRLGKTHGERHAEQQGEVAEDGPAPRLDDGHHLEEVGVWVSQIPHDIGHGEQPGDGEQQTGKG